MRNDKYLLFDNDLKALGRQKIYRFPNGYGASVIRTKWSYTDKKSTWELAVIEFFENDEYYLCYDTPITNDVIGNLKWNQVEEYLEKIKRLLY